MLPPIRLVAVIGVLAVAGALGVVGSQAASPQLRLNLNSGRFLEVITASGTHIRTSSAPGTVIQPGAYQAIVSTEVGDAEDTHHMFHLSGPGENLQTDLLGGDNPTELFAVTLLPSSTYVFEDDRNPQLTRVVFSTSAAGTEATATASSGSGSSGGSASGSTSGPKSSNVESDAVGSRIVAARGTLDGDVSTTGKLSLLFKGKKVSSLKSGRYKISVLDETSRSAFMLQRLSKEPVTVSGRSFVGRRTLTLTLKAGQWMFFSAGGKKSYFIVVSS